jgi:outer membrane protein OmpA-like peptidoglycan-associated protein
MKKAVFFFLLSVGCSMAAMAQRVAVHVGAFEKPVANEYFKGLNTYTSTDQYGIHHYYLQASSANAEQVRKQAQDAGFSQAHIVDFDARERGCAEMCGRPMTIAAPRPVVAPVAPTIQSLKHLFFDFDKADLRGASKEELNKLYQIMTTNPTHTVELSAHTDAKGSNDYNTRLSVRRAEAAKRYLVGRGINASRIKVSTHGEETPIAQNEVNGQDTEQGRQFNRRVELWVFDAAGAKLNSLVEDINVPTQLKK